MRWGLGIVILIYGLMTVDSVSLKWGVIGISLFSIPLLCQLTRSEWIRIWALWGGIFLILQSFLPLFLTEDDFITLQPNIHQIVDVRAGIPGIHGRQLITTDSKGFRVTKDIDYESDESYRIFAIGGSTTEQIYLDDRSTWTHLLQEYLSDKTQLNVEVINTGVSGLRARHHLATLRKIIEMHPDLVIFMVGLNDWNWYIKESFPEKHNIMETISTLRSKLFLRNTMIGKAIKAAIMSKKKPEKKEGKISVRVDYGDYFSRQRDSLSKPRSYSFHPVNVNRQYDTVMSEISRECHSSNLNCVFITQPTGYQKGAEKDFKKGFWMTPPNKPYTLDFESMVYIASLYNSYLIKFAAKNGHRVCDAANRLSPTYDNFYDDCHFNTAGARKISIIIGECLQDIVGQTGIESDVKPDH